MLNNGKDGQWELVYSLTDERGRVVFVGSKIDIMEFVPCTPNQFDQALKRNYRVCREYYITRIGMREVTEFMCSACGRILPKEKMVHRKRRDGSKAPVTICLECNRARNKKFKKERKKKREEKKNADFN